MSIYLITLNLVDAFNTLSRKEVEVDVADEAAAVVVKDAIVVEHATTSDMGINNTTITRKYADVIAVTAGANKDAGVTISVDLGLGKKAPLRFQSPKLALFDANRALILTDPAVVSLEALWTGGDILISDGELPVAFLKGTLDK